MSSSEQFVGVMALMLLVALIVAVVVVGLFVYCVVRLVLGVVRWVRKKRSARAHVVVV